MTAGSESGTKHLAKDWRLRFISNITTSFLIPQAPNLTENNKYS